jgi:hypothetical protein
MYYLIPKTALDPPRNTALFLNTFLRLRNIPVFTFIPSAKLSGPIGLKFGMGLHRRVLFEITEAILGILPQE